MSNVPSYSYYEVAATRIMRDLPRFGHTRTFAYVTGSDEQQQDYLWGLIFAGVFVIAFFLAWTVLVAVFKCLGQKKVGCLSGKPFRVPRDSKRPRRTRIAYIVAAIILVIYSVLLVTKGLTQIKNGVSDVHDSAMEWNQLVAEAKALVSLLIKTVESIAPSQVEMVSNLVQGACSDALENQTGIDFPALAENVSTTVDKFLQYVNETSLEGWDEALEEYKEISNNVADTTDSITLGSWQSLIFLIPFPTMCTFLVIGILLAAFGRSNKKYTCFLSWFITPLFIFLIIICYFLCGALAIGASGNADFCSGGEDNTPTGTITEILTINGYTTDDPTYKLMEFYITTCFDSGGDPVPFLADFDELVGPAISSIETLNESLENVTADTIASFCGSNVYEGIDAVVQSVFESLEDLAKIASEALAIISCETILPIFTTALWNGTCKYSVSGVTWSFSSFLVIAMMGMLMITFRSALLPSEYMDDMDKTSALSVPNDEEKAEYKPEHSEQSPNHAVQAASEGQTTEVEEGAAEDDAPIGMVIVGAAAGAAVVGGAAAVATSGDNDQGDEEDEKVDTPQDDKTDIATSGDGGVGAVVGAATGAAVVGGAAAVATSGDNDQGDDKDEKVDTPQDDKTNVATTGDGGVGAVVGDAAGAACCWYGSSVAVAPSGDDGEKVDIPQDAKSDATDDAVGPGESAVNSNAVGAPAAGIETSSDDDGDNDHVDLPQEADTIDVVANSAESIEPGAVINEAGVAGKDGDNQVGAPPQDARAAVETGSEEAALVGTSATTPQ